MPLIPPKMPSTVDMILVEKLENRVQMVLDNLPFSNEDFKISGFTDSLQDIAACVYLSSHCKSLQKISEAVVQQICFVIFNSNTKLYEELLTSSDATDTDTSKCNRNVLKKFFRELKKLIQSRSTEIHENISGQTAGATLMKRLMCEVLYKNRSNLEPLKILALFCAISGLDIPLLLEANSCCNDIFRVIKEKKRINKTILNVLLEAFSYFPQYFISASAPPEYLKPSDWLEGVMAALLDRNGTKDKTTWLKCIRSLVKISVPLVESNITNLLKTCLFNISVIDADKEEYCGLFTDLISLHSRLHQLPKFFVKLLRSLAESVKEDSVGVYLLEGHLFPSILDSMALHLQELHFGQTIELWTIFSETYTTFGNMSQVFAAAKGVVLILAQIFSTFLLHSKIFESSLPSYIHEKYGELIQHTTKELKDNVSILCCANEKFPVLLQRSFLLLCNVLGKVKLSYTYHDNGLSNDNLTWKSPESPFDFSILFSFFNGKHANMLSIFLNGEDRVLSFLTFQLLILKIEGLMHRKELSADDSTQLKITISCVVQHAEDNIYKNASWDSNMSSISIDNYGTAVWKMLLEHLPLIINTMPSKVLQKISSCLREIILDDKLCDSSDTQTENLKSIVLLSLQSPQFKQSKCFQGLLVSSIWKLDSLLMSRKRLSGEIEEESLVKVLTQLGCSKTKWIKYVESTPLSEESKELNPLWSDIRDTCACLNEILQSRQSAKPKLKAKIYNILQLIDCVPLRYLPPGNQVRCIVGLSTLFFLAPESFKPGEVLKIAEKIAKQLIVILDGERIAWLFDFVASGPYLREMVNTIEKLIEMEQSVEIPLSLKLLLEHLIGASTRSIKVLPGAEEYFSELVKEENFSTVSILVLNLLLQKLSQIFRRTELKAEYKIICEQLASSACSYCVKSLKKYNAKSVDSTYCALIECYTEVVEILTLPALTIDQKKRDRCLSQIPTIIEFSKQTISDRQSKEDNSKNDLNNVILKFFARLFKHNEHITNFMPDALHSNIWDCIYSTLQSRCTSSTLILNEASPSLVSILEEDEIGLLQYLFPLLSFKELNNVFEEISKEMKNWDFAYGNPHVLQMNLDILKQIIHCDSQKKTSFITRESLANLLSYLSYCVNQADDSYLRLNVVTLPILHFVNFLIQQKISYISDDQWLDCLHLCVTMDLCRLSSNMPMFVRAFDAVWSVVYHLLVYHPGFIMKIIPVFLLIVTNLLKSLVKAGSQDAVRDSSNDIQDSILTCSQNMDRLLSVITRHKTEFAKLAIFLIGDYADCVQHITLDTNIKGHLLSGLNRLLSICSEDSIKMVSVNINNSCREIFSNIVKDYNQSRYRGYV